MSYLVIASWILPAKQNRSPLSLATLPGCFLRALASEPSPGVVGDVGAGATEAGRLGGRGGKGLFALSCTGVPTPGTPGSDIRCSKLGVPGVADGAYSMLEDATDVPIGICMLVLVSRPESYSPQDQSRSVTEQIRLQGSRADNLRDSSQHV